jgi:transposase
VGLKEIRMPYIVGHRRQSLLLPECIDDYIGEADPVRVYDAFVEQLELAALGIEVDPDRVGHPEFDPQAMLKLLVYGYSYGVRSSRKLERATHHNLSFIWLMGGLKPDHKTIARFRRNHCDALKNVLRQCARLCAKLGLIEGNTLFVDGTKVRANASMKHTWTPERCQKSLQEIDRRIEEILEECEAADAGEEQQPSLVARHRELGDQRQLKARVQSILEELRRDEKTAINTTDPQSGRLRSGAQIEAGYNHQVVTDDRHGLIVHSEVVSQSNDVGLFSDQIQGAHETLGKCCQTACADAGFSSPEDLERTLGQGVDVVVPIVRHSDFREHFTYEAEQDRYRCPEGRLLRYVGDNKNNKTRMYDANGSLCRCCPRWGTCTKRLQGRRVERPYTEAVRERLERRCQDGDARALMRRRKMRAEHPFGHIKHNLGIKTFLLRGLSGVRAEAALAATAFNLARMLTIVGARELVQNLAPVPAAT